MFSFKAKLETFLQPKSDTAHSSKFARTQEARYKRAYDFFDVSNNRSQCDDRITQICLGFFEEKPHGRSWKMGLMARCYLLKVHFHYSDDLQIQLGNLATEARQASNDSIKDKYFVQASMDDVEGLCTEIKWRIRVEQPRDRFLMVEHCDDGSDHSWILRMTAEWLKATDGCTELLKQNQSNLDKLLPVGDRTTRHEKWGICCPAKPRCSEIQMVALQNWRSYIEQC